MNSQIVSVGYFLPEMKVSSIEIEEKINKNADFHHFPHGIIEHMTGVKDRYFVGEGEYASDLAIEASKKAISKSGIDKNQIDLLIFASASQDIIEPATANIVQKGLGISCPVFDVKNACNSFLNGIDIADSMIKAGKYKNILICSGETPSKVIKYDVKNRADFKNYFAGYTLGDAGAAMILRWAEDNKGIQKTFFYSDGSSWNLATIMGGGSRFPHDDKNYFSGDPGKIRDKFVSIGPSEFDKGLRELGWDKKEIKQIFVHQVAVSTFDQMIQVLGIEEDKCIMILPEVGNIASCCIPLAYARYTEKYIVSPGDKFIFLGFASGFSYSIIYYEA